MRKFTNEEIAKIQEVREIVNSICNTTTCELCPLLGENGCEQTNSLEILDNIICYTENNRGES